MIAEVKGFRRELQRVKSHKIIRWIDLATGSRIEVFSKTVSTTSIDEDYDSVDSETDSKIREVNEPILKSSPGACAILDSIYSSESESES